MLNKNLEEGNESSDKKPKEIFKKINLDFKIDSIKTRAEIFQNKNKKNIPKTVNFAKDEKLQNK